MGLINSMIYLDELSKTPAWAIFVVMLGIGSLIYGVLLLSEAKEDPKDVEEPEVTKDGIPLSPVLWDSADRRTGESNVDSNEDNNDNSNNNNNNNNSPYPISNRNSTARKRKNDSTVIERDSLPPFTPDIIIDNQIPDNNRSSYTSKFNDMSSDTLSITTMDDYDDEEYSISEARSYEDLLSAKYRSNP